MNESIVEFPMRVRYMRASKTLYVKTYRGRRNFYRNEQVPEEGWRFCPEYLKQICASIQCLRWPCQPHVGSLVGSIILGLTVRVAYKSKTERVLSNTTLLDSNDPTAKSGGKRIQNHLWIVKFHTTSSKELHFFLLLILLLYKIML